MSTMSTDTSTHVITTSVRLPILMRSRLEHLRLARASRGMRLPRLRELIHEAVEMLLDAEMGAVRAG